MYADYILIPPPTCAAQNRIKNLTRSLPIRQRNLLLTPPSQTLNAQLRSFLSPTPSEPHYVADPSPYPNTFASPSSTANPLFQTRAIWPGSDQTRSSLHEVRRVFLAELLEVFDVRPPLSSVESGLGQAVRLDEEEEGYAREEWDGREAVVGAEGWTIGGVALPNLRDVESTCCCRSLLLSVSDHPSNPSYHSSHFNLTRAHSILDPHPTPPLSLLFLPFDSLASSSLLQHAAIPDSSWLSFICSSWTT